jgi:membrane protein YqaA with SNARE-associated domain
MLPIVSNSIGSFARGAYRLATTATCLLASEQAASLRHSLSMLIRHFGALAFFPLGLLDMSLVPLPGGFDILLIAITAAHPDLWWYYALMAAAGSVFGAWPSYHLGQRGGEDFILKRLGRARTRKLLKAYRRWGFWFLFAGAIAPPPMPASAVVLTAGAMRYPQRKFLLSWSLTRLLRFGLIAWITMRFGRNIFHWLRTEYASLLWVLVAFAAAAAIAAALLRWLRKHHLLR